MPEDFSFDIVSKVDMQEVVNAINQADKEIIGRYDFKDTNTTIEFNKEERTITVKSIDDYKVRTALDVMMNKMAKRGVPLKALKADEPVESGIKSFFIKVTIQEGIPQEKAKDIVKFIKDTKLKVQPSIQKDVIRVSGRKKDDLQDVIAALKQKDFGIDTQFTNYR
jgi:uncharacterized protein YajQ (UPF0234 family)